MWEEAAGPWAPPLPLGDVGPHRQLPAAAPPQSWNLQVRRLIKESNSKTPVSMDTVLGGQPPPRSWDEEIRAGWRDSRSLAHRAMQPGRGASWPIWGKGQCCLWGVHPEQQGTLS